MSVRSTLALIGLCFLALYPALPARAGGPMLVNRDGRPFVWDNTRPIAYTMDPGPLGIYSNAQAAQWVAEAFQAWASVDGVQLSFQPTSPYSSDLSARNVLQVLDALPETTSLVILDSDGGVLDTLFGDGYSDGVAGVGIPSGIDPRTGKITGALAIISGKDSRHVRTAWIRGALIQHELGHFLGLTHSQINADVKLDGDATNDALAPCMSYNEGPNDTPHLHLDDRAWIAALYPKPGAAAAAGTIRGRVLLPDGATGLQGIQVVARREGDEQASAVSGVSGYRFKTPQGTGSLDPALQGVYELPGLPAGKYRLTVEPLTEMPHVDPLHGFLPGGRRYWRESLPLGRELTEAASVTVEAGQVIEARNFTLDGEAPTLASVREAEPNDIPEMAATLPLGAVVTGRVGPQDDGLLEIELADGDVDVVEDFYRVVVTEPTTLTATLTATNSAADLQLFLVGFIPELSTAFPLPLATSAERGTPPEIVQERVEPGVYFLGVSTLDSGSNPASDYRLTLLATPSPDLAVTAPVPPRITLATVSQLTQTGFRVSWRTDQDANAVVLVDPQLQEFGSPEARRDHTLAVTGLTRSTFYTLDLHSRTAEGALSEFPPLLVNTAVPGSGSSPVVSTGLSTALAQDDAKREFLLFARVSNLGNGPANNVKVERLTLPSGWQFVEPPSLPLDLGAIGPFAYAVVAVRVLRAESTAAPLDLGIQGTYANVAGAARSFGR
jgi:hypothetical protein